MTRRRLVGTAVVLIGTLAAGAASAADPRETAGAFPGREPAARVVIKAPPVMPGGYTLNVEIDGVTLPKSKLGVPVPVAPGERKITYAARRDDYPETQSFDLFVRDGTTARFQIPAFELGPSPVGLGLGVGATVLGSGGLATSIWVLHEAFGPEPETSPEEEGDPVRGIAQLLGILAVLSSAALTAGGIAITVDASQPSPQWSAPVVEATPSGVALRF